MRKEQEPRSYDECLSGRIITCEQERAWVTVGNCLEGYEKYTRDYLVRASTCTGFPQVLTN